MVRNIIYKIAAKLWYWKFAIANYLNGTGKSPKALTVDGAHSMSFLEYLTVFEYLLRRIPNIIYIFLLYFDQVTSNTLFPKKLHWIRMDSNIIIWLVIVVIDDETEY